MIYFQQKYEQMQRPEDEPYIANETVNIAAEDNAVNENKRQNGKCKPMQPLPNVIVYAPDSAEKGTSGYR